jgi:hypothetical protein
MWRSSSEPATGVSATAVRQDTQTREERVIELVVTNDRDVPVKFEAELEEGGAKLSSETRLSRRDGRPLWVVTVPANGSRTLRYRIRLPD